jgi:hypothetical protein
MRNEELVIRNDCFLLVLTKYLANGSDLAAETLLIMLIHFLEKY